MSVYQKKNSPYWHYDFVCKGRRFHGSTGCTGKRDAQRVEAEERRRAVLGDTKPPDITVDEACGTWWTARGMRLASAATSEYQLKNLVGGLGRARLLADLTLGDFDSYVARRLGTGIKNASVNREIELARRIWRFVEMRGFDVPKIRWGELLLKEPVERVRELSADEESRLMDKLGEDLRNVVEFAMLSGQRRTSVITLLWSKVDFIGRRASVRVKGDRWHTFPLTPRMIALIASQPRAAAQVFTYRCMRSSPLRAGRPRRLMGERYPFSRQGWTRQWRKALADAGIEDFRFHDLRHTRATRLLRETGNLKAVQKLLGHSEIATTAKYAHVIEEDLRAAMERSESRNSPEQQSHAQGKKLGKTRGTG